MENLIYRQYVEGLAGVERGTREQGYSMSSRHFHDTYELYCLLEGEVYYFIDKETYLVKAGDVVLVRPGQIHKTSMTKSSRHSRILFQIREEALDPFLEKNDFYPLKEVYDRNDQIIRLSTEDVAKVEGLALQVRDEMRDRKRKYELMVKTKLLELLVLLARYQKHMLPEKEIALTPKHQKVHEVADYLQTHFDTREQLEELAGRFYVSKSYLCRIFREVTGLGISEYTNIVRVRKAQNLLANGDYSVTEIAGMLGFESITYFERVFKKYTACTPLKYRKEKRRY